MASCGLLIVKIAKTMHPIMKKYMQYQGLAVKGSPCRVLCPDPLANLFNTINVSSKHFPQNIDRKDEDE